MKQTVSFLCWRIYSTPQREATQTAVLQLISFSHRSTHFKTAIHIYSSQSTEDLWIQLWAAAISTLIQPHMSSKTDWKFTAPKKKVNTECKISLGWVWKDRNWVAEGKHSGSAVQNWWETLELSALPGGLLNKDQPFRTLYKSSGRGLGRRSVQQEEMGKDLWDIW